MDAPPADPARFLDVPYAIHAPASASRLAAAAAAALPAARVTLDPRGMDVGAYRSMLARFRDEIGTRLPTAGYRIDVLDRTADDLRAEGRRVDRVLSSFGEALKAPAAAGAFSGPYRGKRGLGCVITGFPPGLDVPAMLSAPLGGGPAATGDLDGPTFHWFTLRHELGHCLLGANEARADAFAALLAVHDGVLDARGISTFAAFRETQEWADSRDRDHFTSAALWDVARRADALAANPRFMAMSVEEIAGLARTVADKVAPGQARVDEAKAVRRGLRAASGLPAGVEGLGSELARWVGRHRAIPALARIDDAFAALARGGPPLPAFVLDAAALQIALSDLSGRGDATAAAFLAGMASAPRTAGPGADFAADIPVARASPAFDYAALPVNAPSPARWQVEEALGEVPRLGMR